MVNRSRESALSWLSTMACLTGLFGVFAPLTLQAAVGRTGGNFEVSTTGAATYTIPLFTIQGPGGIQPSVALLYSSNADGGYLGRGWTLSGNVFSSIRRCNKTIAQDGVAAPPSLDLNDRYCLDGNRLRLQSGTYAQHGSVWATEIADFSRITAGPAGSFWTGPTSWTVERKDGLLYTYGGTSDSYVQPGIEWKLSEISDRSGNKMRITWEVGDWNATHPLKIEWTQTSSGSGSYVYSMDFHYSAGGNAPASAHWRYYANQPSIDSDLLTHITVSVSGTVVRNYVLTYELSPTSAAKRLIEVQECSNSAATDCLSPTIVAYQNGVSGVDLGSPALNLTGNITDANGDYDFNGDGIRDIAYKVSDTWYVRMGSVSSGYGSEINTGVIGTLRAGKLLGTLADQMVAASGGTWYVYAWNGSSFSTTSTGIATGVSSTDILVADMDGDGLDDLFYLTGTGVHYNGYDAQSPWVNFALRRNTTASGSLSFAPPIVSQWIMESSSQFQSPPWDHGIAAEITYVALSKGGDRDGDGRQDMNLYVAGEWGFFPAGGIEYYSMEGAFEESFALWDASGPWPEATSLINNIVWWGVPPTVTLIPADFNGDNCHDYLVHDWAYGVTSPALSSCDGVGHVLDGYTYGSVIGVADWTGDGNDDYFMLNGSTLHVRAAQGGTMGDLVDTGIPVGTGCALVRTDGNGDSLDDIGCLYTGSGLTLYYHNATATVPDLAAHFVDGFGITHSPSYASIERSNYSPYLDAVYPYRDVRSDRRVVGQVTSSDGIGDTYTTTYEYFGAQVNLEGRGFVGFEKIEAVDSRNGVKRVRKFEREFPYNEPLSRTPCTRTADR